MEYSSTPYVGMARGGGGKRQLHVTCTKSYVQNSALDVVISLYEPYQSVSSVFISNKVL